VKDLIYFGILNRHYCSIIICCPFLKVLDYPSGIILYWKPWR